MNDELQKALSEIINKTLKGVDAGVSFLQQELPEVIQQLLIWHAVESALLCLTLFLASLLCAWGAKKIWVFGKAEGCGAEGFALIPGAIGVAFAAFAINTTTWLKILIAPKLYLVEYAASLIK